jgi:hypothetical protein
VQQALLLLARLQLALLLQQLQLLQPAGALLVLVVVEPCA